MKAVVTKEYGDVDVLEIKEVETPTISADNEIIVEVKAASINPLDWRIRSGEMKIMTGKTPPKILGSDFSGVITELGSNISKYKIGDEVYGLINGIKQSEGAHAQFIKVVENDICKKPENVNFEDAASFPMATLTSHMALFDVANTSNGSDVLINGCSGGVGSAAVQIAKASDCKVTGVCSSANVDFSKEIGADKVVDYKKENVLDSEDRYDVIFDTVGNLEFSKSKKLLKPGGVYVTTAVTLPIMLFSPIVNKFRSKKLKIVMAAPDSNILDTVKNFVEAGKVKSVVSKTFDFDNIKDAYNLSESGGFTGKIIIKM